MKDLLPARPSELSTPEQVIGSTSLTSHRCHDLPVNREETYANPDAMGVFMEEWKGLWDQHVFDFSVVRENHDATRKRRTNESTWHEFMR